MELAIEIGQHLDEADKMPERQTLKRLNDLAGFIRHMSLKDIKAVADKLYEDDKDQKNFHSQKGTERLHAWKAYRDAAAEAGSPSSFLAIFDWIKVEKKVMGYEAAHLLARQTKAIRYPTKEVMEKFFELATCDEVRRQAGLNTTALLSLSGFLSYAQVSNVSSNVFYPTLSYGRFTSRKYDIVPAKVIPYFEQEMHKASKEGDSHKMLVYCRALGQLGHPDIR